jgi:hypothetical protein
MLYVLLPGHRHSCRFFGRTVKLSDVQNSKPMEILVVTTCKIKTCVFEAAYHKQDRQRLRLYTATALQQLEITQFLEGFLPTDEKWLVPHP